MGCVARTLERTSLLGVLEITDVPDESDGKAGLRRAVATGFIELIVHDEELLVVDVKNPALMSVYERKN
jgi:hypothetical protein